MVELISGDPWRNEKESGLKNPASYTRFLLPFSYSLQPIEDHIQIGSAEELYFKSFSTREFDRERKLYFTSETANVLYERATWARVPETAWKRNPGRCGPFLFTPANSAAAIQVTLAQPWILLFEEPHHPAHTHALLQHGLLILEAQFSETAGQCPSLDDMLEFNDLFRFVDNPYEQHAENFARSLADFPADFQNGKKIKDCDTTSYFCLYKKRWLSLLGIPLLHHGTRYRLHSAQVLADEVNNDHSGHLSCENRKCLTYADNRTFVWTCALLDAGALSLAKRYGGNVAEPWSFGHWLRLLNVDAPEKTPARTHCSVTGFERQWLQERTYQRWAEQGTYYGYCYHSGAMIAPSWQSPPLWYHFGQMYFDQILLLFYLRISLFTFSRELTNINQENNTAELRKSFKRLRRSFAKFTNLYQFPLISNQQQGIEMYDIARKSMDIDELFRDVRDEITSTHDFLEMEATFQLGKKANYITWIGLFIAIIALPHGLLSAIWLLIRTYGVLWGGLLFDILLIGVFFWSYRKRQPQWLWEFMENIRSR